MTEVNFEIHAEKRDDLGTSASRRLRHAGKLPAILYGDHQDAVSLTLQHSELEKALKNEAFYIDVLNVIVDGTPIQAVLKDLQRHPYKPFILHADFLRVNESKKLRKKIPLHFTNEELCAGVRTGGGSITHFRKVVEIECLPQHLPSFIEVDTQELTVGEGVLLSQLPLPEGVEIPALRLGKKQDIPVMRVKKGRGK